MATTVPQSVLSSALTSMMTSMMTSSSSPNTVAPLENTSDPKEYHTVLLVINSVVLLSGIISLSLMMHIMRFSSTSITSIAVLNLIFTHFIFLLTVPFRIYYYANHQWDLGPGLCRVISGMIHIHMYMSFLFYVIILVTRLMSFYYNTELVVSFQKFHALLISGAVWIVVLVVVPCIMHSFYGKIGNNKGSENNTNTTCFKFGNNIAAAKVLNYIVSIVIILVASVLTGLQANTLRVLYKKHHEGCSSQQDYGAQQKSLCFALVMVVCFIPYHMFRLNYLEKIHLENVNEVFLTLTTFNCLDMLTFLGRRTWFICCPKMTF
ncbi:probable G-protein coupled receptor 141 [Gymnodraco acuticeps]|uniref:Probable G-protein coupled receptor 141 n=1 Tax=Gymnodraco acuticeps TaxID=8218 RepID=A0A6P8V5W1_GYMAC|nr:probable G-protein coupled receptor 141 [Gymnodraco acuticeps]XP_034080841.1 probable G-protein coupled receptor 141 [Gymnodraco acuticeps]